MPAQEIFATHHGRSHRTEPRCPHAGLRVTSAAAMEVVEMVLSGTINKQIVCEINRLGGHACGISGKDANLMIAKKITEMPDPESNLMQAVDIGYVGDPIEVNPHIVEEIRRYHETTAPLEPALS